MTKPTIAFSRGPEFGRRPSLLQRLFNPVYDRQPIFEPAEVAALLKYASERGMDTDDGLLIRLFRALEEYEKSPMSDVQNQQGIAQTNAEVVLHEYAKLTKLANGVNGRNLLYGRHLIVETKWFLIVTFIFFLFSISALAFGTWRADEVFPDDPIINAPFAHFIQYFAPFLWGALGSCVYILKRVADEAAENRFDPDKFQGWFTRALLGAVLGGTVVYVVDPAAFGTVELSLTALAFLMGLGSKVVYGAIERMIQLLSEKMNLDAIGKDTTADSISRFLAKQIAITNPDTQPEKYAVLVDLLGARTKKEEPRVLL